MFEQKIITLSLIIEKPSINKSKSNFVLCLVCGEYNRMRYYAVWDNMLYNNMYQLHYDSLKNTLCKYLLLALPISADKENFSLFSDSAFEFILSESNFKKSIRLSKHIYKQN